MKGVVPFFEEYDAMISANYNSTEWKDLPPLERAEAVAHLRLRKHINLHESDALKTDMKRRIPKK